MVKVDVVIPMYHSNNRMIHMLELLEGQSVCPNKVILMNTDKSHYEKDDRFKDVIGRYNATGKMQVEVYHVTPEEFDHGKTRDEGIRHAGDEYVLLMTDDAVPQDDKLVEHMVKAFEDSTIGVVYARQLANPNSGKLEKLTREFNYPGKSVKKTIEDVKTLGIKAYFCSNVCAMYRREIYNSLGGFVKKTIFNEDMIFAAKLMQNGYAVFYEKNAAVYHSHKYSLMKQLRRNFDLGVSQADHPEVFDNVPSESEGKKLVSFVSKRIKRNVFLLFYFYMQCAFKLLGYKLGKKYKKLPQFMIRKLTMNPNYWKE